MIVFWIEAQPWDPAIAGSLNVRACSADLSAITLWGGGQEWLPVMDGGLITDTNVFNGSFSGATEASRGEVALVSGAGEIDDWARLAWPDRPVKIWQGEILNGETGAPVWPAARTLIFDGEATSFDPDEAKLALSVKTPAGKIADATYSGVGGIEGTIELKGTVKPFAAGQHVNQTAVLVNAGKVLFQVHGYGAIQQLQWVREAGRKLDQPAVFHATFDALFNATVPATQIHVHLGTGSFRLGFSPVGDITADFLGDVLTAGYSGRTGAIVKRLLAKTGWDMAKVDQPSLAAIDTALPHDIAMIDEAGTDVADKLNELLLNCAGYWDVDELGVFYVGQVTAGAPAFSIGDEGQADYDLLELDHLPTRAPFFRNRMGYGFNPKPITFAGTEIGATPAQLQLIQDAQNAANAGVDVFFQPAAPVAPTFKLLDIWYDTDDQLWYRAEGSPLAWVLTRDAGVGQAILAASGAQATADGKIRSFYVDAQPVYAPGPPPTIGVGDLWTRPSDNPKITRRWNGTIWDLLATYGATAEQAAAIVTAQNAANAAQGTANTAASNASSALSQIGNVVDNGMLDRSEKPEEVRRKSDIDAQFAAINTQARNEFQLHALQDAHGNALDSLNYYLGSLTPAWNDYSADTPIVRATYISWWTAYYSARQNVLNAIATALASRAAAAQTTANSAGAAAETAQNAANAAQLTANTASGNASSALSQIGAIVNDGILDRSEKPGETERFNTINAQYAGIEASATSVAINGGAEWNGHVNAKNALNTYLVGLSPAWNDAATDTPIVRATYILKWQDYYTARQALLNAIAAVLRTRAADAQTTGSNAMTRIDTSDNPQFLDRAEKVTEIARKSALDNQFASINNQARVEFGLNALADAHGNALDALNSYLNGLVPSWTSLTSDTPIVRATYDAKWLDYITARQNILNAIAAALRVRAADAQTAANNAGGAAATAQGDATVALGEVTDISADNRLSKAEKKIVIERKQTVDGAYAGINSSATAVGIATTGHVNAYNDLTNYLNSVSYTNQNANTTIVRATYNSKWTNYYAARQALLDAIANELKVRAAAAALTATWASVTGPGRPADGATADMVLIPNASATVRGNAVTSTTAVDGGGGAATADRYLGACQVVCRVGALGTYLALIGTSQTYSCNIGGDGLVRGNTPAGYAYLGFGAAVGNIIALVNDETQVRIIKNGVVAYTSPIVPVRQQTWYANISCLGFATITGVSFRAGSDNAWAAVGGPGRPSDNAGTSLSLLPVGPVGFVIQGNSATMVQPSGSQNQGVVSAVGSIGHGRIDFKVPLAIHAHVYLSIDNQLSTLRADGVSGPSTVGGFFGIGWGFSGNQFFRTLTAGAGDFSLIGNYTGLVDNWSIFYNGVECWIEANGTEFGRVTVPAGRRVFFKAMVFSAHRIEEINFSPYPEISRSQLFTSDGRPISGATFNANTNFGLRALSRTPGMSSSTNGTTATINLDANGRFYPDSGGELALPSASFPGLALSTRYYFWRNMPVPTGIGTSYGIATTISSALGPTKAYLGFYDTPAADGGGGGGGGFGGGGCVASDAWVPTKDRGDVRACDLVAGDSILVLDKSFTGSTWGEVQSNAPARNIRVSLATESGARLSMSINTPLTLRDGRWAIAANGWGHEIAVQRGDNFEWERIVDIKLEREEDVAKIGCNDGTFAAGSEQGIYIFSHNLPSTESKL